MSKPGQETLSLWGGSILMGAKGQRMTFGGRNKIGSKEPVWVTGILWLFLSGCAPESPPVTGETVTGEEKPVDWNTAIPEQLILSGQQAGDPWALAHLHLALPEEPSLESQRQELFRLLTDSNAEIPVHGHDGHRGEQHPHLLLRTAILLAGETIPDPLLTRVRSDLSKTSFPVRWQEVNDLAWLVESAARASLPGESSASGTTLAHLYEKMIIDLEAADRTIGTVLNQAPDSGVRRPDGLAGPEESGCWAYTCSGAHMLGALVECDLAGLLSSAQKKRMAQLLKRYRQRTDWEIAYRKSELNRAIQNGVSPRRAVREYGLAVTKLLGHALEISARASLMTPTEDGREFSVTFGRWSVELMTQVDDLFSQRVDISTVEVYQPLELLTADVLTPQSPVWERAFGDLCHLFRGLRLLKNPQRF